VFGAIILHDGLKRKWEIEKKFEKELEESKLF
jgi:hypothetical protein